MSRLAKYSLFPAFIFLFMIPSLACSPTALKSVYTMPARGTLAVTDTDPRQVMVMSVNRKGDEHNVTTLSTFQSSDPKVVSVSANGGALGVSSGYANITVSYTEGKVTKTAVLPVTVVWSRGEGRTINW